jgi:hypothetical protein
MSSINADIYEVIETTCQQMSALPDKDSDYESVGREFESLRARHSLFITLLKI